MVAIQEIKESWSEIWDQLSTHVVIEPGKLSFFGFMTGEEDPNYYAKFSLTGRPYEGANRSLIFETATSQYIYQFFSRNGKNYVLFNGGRGSYMKQNLLPKFTVIGDKKEMDLDSF